MATAGMESITKLKSTDPTQFLKQNPELSLSSRIASQYLFSLLKPYTPKTPFDELHTEGFDAEQIWQQIDIQSKPLIFSLERDIHRFEKNPEKISSLFGGKEEEREFEGDFDVGLERDSEEEEEEDGGESDSEGESDEEEDGEDDGEEEDEEMEEDDGDGTPEVEDDFFKIKELEKFLAHAEEEEYDGEESLKKKQKKGSKVKKKVVNEEENDDEESESESDDDTKNADSNELLMYGGMDDSEDEDAYNIRFEDFYLPNKKLSKQREKRVDKSYDLEMEDKEEDEDDDETDIMPKRRRKQVNESDESQELEMDDGEGTQKNENLSTHERERLKLEAKIKKMEEANLAAKDWTMLGEVQASNRPRDSALEVDLDFEHNVRPPPVITEEVTASLEDIIKKRISEGLFDDVQRPAKLPSAAPKERKELDDNKSKKGLAQIYEEEYAQQTGLAAAPLSHNDELRKEASGLFKKLCLKLDALSHFHFAPKPVVEDMSIQTNVAALAIEEIAPVAVSDAAMLAPEEVFAGKGDIKEDEELTKEDRKKIRAKIKRKFKAVNAAKTANKPADKTLHTEGKED